MIKEGFTNGWTSDNYDTWNNMDQNQRIQLASNYFNTLFRGNPIAAQNAVAQFVNETGNYGNFDNPYKTPTTSTVSSSTSNTNSNNVAEAAKSAEEENASGLDSTNTNNTNNTTTNNNNDQPVTNMENSVQSDNASAASTSNIAPTKMGPSRSNSGRNSSSNPMLNNNDNREAIAKQTNNGITSGNVMSFGVSDENQKTISSNILKTNKFGLLKRK